MAASTNNVIGKDNKLLWHLPNDLRFFKNITWPLPVIMGRKTFEAIGSNPLKGRHNIIITRQKDFAPPGVSIVNDLDTALRLAELDEVNELSIIGGGQIYEQAMKIATRIYMTRVHAKLEGDTFFPEIDPNLWRMQSRIDHDADDKHKYAYSFERWEKV